MSTTSSTPVTTGGWHEVQVRVRINGASGEAETRFDGVRIASLSKTENFGTTPIGRLQIGENSSDRPATWPATSGGQYELHHVGKRPDVEPIQRAWAGPAYGGELIDVPQFIASPEVPFGAS